MPSSIVNVTLQACILAATSCIIGQVITAYKSNVPLLSQNLDLTQIMQFVVFTILNSPPNFLWQTYLESAFPSAYLSPSMTALHAASENNEKELDREQKSHEILEAKLHIRNTATKFVLDQTIGAAVNLLQFSLVMAGFKGATLAQAVQIAKQDFWPLMVAGWKLWPIISLINFTVVKTVAGRQLVGGLAGMVWNVYLSLVTGNGPEIKQT